MKVPMLAMIWKSLMKLISDGSFPVRIPESLVIIDGPYNAAPTPKARREKIIVPATTSSRMYINETIG